MILKIVKLKLELKVAKNTTKYQYQSFFLFDFCLKIHVFAFFFSTIRKITRLVFLEVRMEITSCLPVLPRATKATTASLALAV